MNEPGKDDNGASTRGPNLLSVPIRELMSADPVTIAYDQTVRNAARLMREHNISCLPVLGDNGLAGIVTLRDLRDRVIAEAASLETPIERIMTRGVATIGVGDSAFDALLLLTQRGISHLPVIEEGRVAGIITHTNLVRRQTASAVYIVSDIRKCPNVDAIVKVVAQVPRLLVDLVDSGASPNQIGRIVTSVTDAATLRLIALAEAELGPAPVGWAWLACGSQGRREQTGKSDQDNCMILEDRYDEAEHGSYFEAFARFVVDGLNACGYVYCPGDMMATTPKWRQPLAQWRRYFEGWIERPEPMAQMLASVMFDLRVIAGDAGLYGPLQQESLERASRNSIFVAHMVSNALTHRPPLGWFGSLSVKRTGEDKGKVDLKHGGVVPVVDIARVYAFSAGIEAVNTYDRLQAGREAGVLSESGARDLLDAYEFISAARLQHQARQSRAGGKPDNLLVPDELSGLERGYLRDAFKVVKTIQSALSNKHQIGAR